jgi:ribonuclease G
MRRDLLIAAGPGEWRAALLEDGDPVELRVERGDGAEIDSIYLGRVVAVLPALGAALVDIGGERPSFLPQSEIFPRGARLDEGAAVVVQIRRETQGGKAAQLTTAVTLRGRFVELTGGRRGLAGAEALPPEDRARLAAAAGEAAIGLRLRRAAPIETLADEVRSLRARWDDIARRAARIEPPARVYSAAGHAEALAAAVSPPERIFVDAPAAVAAIRAAFLGGETAVLPEEEWPIDLDALVDAALSPTIAFAGGGTLHVEQAAAATLIDVDSGTPATGSPQPTALATNLAAAAAIARQIRLRNLGGGIVIDFVGLDDHRGRERVRAALVAAVASDPLRPQILGWTRLGHLELVRRRRARPFAELLLERTAPVKTAASVAYQALRALARAARAEPGRAWRLIAAPDVAAALAGEATAALRALEQRLGRTIAIDVDPGPPRERFQLAPL